MPRKLPRIVSVRLSEDEYQLWISKVRASGLSLSAFFRKAVLGNATTVRQVLPPSKDWKRLAFLFSKASNNINQLAHQANSAHLRGILDQQLFLRILQTLMALTQALKEGLAP